MNTIDPQVALANLIAALERHLDVIVTSDGEDESRIEAVEEKLIDAFETYDSALFENFSIATPFAVFDDFEEDSESEEDEFEEDFDDFEDDEEDDEYLEDELEEDEEIDFDELDSDFDDFDELEK